jgi:hypothetical protein
MPKLVKPEEINGPVMVKYHGAKGGRGFFVAKNYEDFLENVDKTRNTTSRNSCGYKVFPSFLLFAPEDRRLHLKHRCAGNAKYGQTCRIQC